MNNDIASRIQNTFSTWVNTREYYKEARGGGSWLLIIAMIRNYNRQSDMLGALSKLPYTIRNRDCSQAWKQTPRDLDSLQLLRSMLIEHYEEEMRSDLGSLMPAIMHVDSNLDRVTLDRVTDVHNRLPPSTTQENTMPTYNVKTSDEIQTVQFLFGEVLEQVTDDKLISRIGELQAEGKTLIAQQATIRSENISKRIDKLQIKINALSRELDSPARIKALA